MTQLILWFMGIWNDYLAPTILFRMKSGLPAGRDPIL